MVSLVRTRRGAGDRHRGTEQDAAVLRVSILRRVPVAGPCSVVFRAASRIALYSQTAGDLISAVFGREDEGSALSLLPPKVLTTHQIESRIDQRVRPRECIAGQVREPDVVMRIETRESLRLPLMRSTEIAAHQAIAVEVV